MWRKEGALLWGDYVNEVNRGWGDELNMIYNILPPPPDENPFLDVLMQKCLSLIWSGKHVAYKTDFEIINLFSYIIGSRNAHFSNGI